MIKEMAKDFKHLQMVKNNKAFGKLINFKNLKDSAQYNDYFIIMIVIKFYFISIKNFFTKYNNNKNYIIHNIKINY